MLKFSNGKIILVGAIVAIITGCVYGPKVEQKKPLSYLNGENYETSPTGADQLVVPVVKRKERMTHIEGTIVIGSGINRVTLKLMRVELIDNNSNKSLFAVTSNEEGKFEFADVIRNGSYTLRLISNRYSGSRQVEVTDYEIKDAVIEASRVE